MTDEGINPGEETGNRTINEIFLGDFFFKSMNQVVIKTIKKAANNGGMKEIWLETKRRRRQEPWEKDYGHWLERQKKQELWKELKELLARKIKETGSQD